MPLCRKCFLDDAFGGFNFDRIEDRFLRNSNALFTKGLQDIRLGNAFKTLELDVANDRKLFNFKNHAHAAAGSIFDRHARADLVKEVQREDRLQVTRDCGFAVDVAGARLDVIEDIFFAQSTIADDIDLFDDALLGLLRAHRRGNRKKTDADNQADCGKQKDAIKVHK